MPEVPTIIRILTLTMPQILTQIDGLCQKYWPLHTNFSIDGICQKYWPLHRNFSIDGLCRKYWPLHTNFSIVRQCQKHWPLHTNLVLTDYARNTERNTRISTIHTAHEVPVILITVPEILTIIHAFWQFSTVCVRGTDRDGQIAGPEILPSIYNFHTNFKRFEHGMVDTN